MSEYEFAIAYLKALETLHKYFFDNKQKTIMDYVVIKGKIIPHIQVVNSNLPIEIKHAIETMFFIEY